MDDAKRELVRAWLIEARHELDTARQISGLSDGYLDAAIYHRQRPKKRSKAFLPTAPRGARP